VIGVVLAGGASTRFGAKPKGLAILNGRAMVLGVADILAAVCDRVLIEAPRDAGYETIGLQLIHAASEHAGKGPLAAMAAGLAHAGKDNRVAFAPCDMPLLTPPVYRALANASGIGAYARTPLGVEPLVAVLSNDIQAQIQLVLTANPIPRTHVVLDATGVRVVDFTEARLFANVNTPADLAQIEASLRD
jgi:molybdopterin-guanine dinucleotide biosynthesis protein A